MKRSLVILALISALLPPVAAGGQPIPTSEWISVWSDNVTFNTRPVPPGAVIRAYDPDGVLCGEFSVTTAGSYGLMPVYRDDPFTPNIDEGALPGDAITFKLEGMPVEAVSSQTVLWSFNGDIIKHDLWYEAVVPTAEWVSFWSNASMDAGVPVAAGSVVRAYDSSGALCGEFVVTTPGSYGVMAVYRDDSFTPDIDEGADPGELIRFTIDGETATTTGPDVAMWGSDGQIRHVDIDVPESLTGTEGGAPAARLALGPNAPNPFGTATSFDVEVTGTAPVAVTVYDVRGRVVRHLLRDRVYATTAFRMWWDGRNDTGEFVPKGVYFVELREGRRRDVRKMTLVR